MSIEERFEQLRKYMNIYIDLLPYTHQVIGTYTNQDKVVRKLYALRKSDIPTFADYLEPNPRAKGWKDWKAPPPMQRTMYVNGYQVVNTYCGGVWDPKESPDFNWLYYYRYDTWHGCRFNVTEKVFNKNVKVNER